MQGGQRTSIALLKALGATMAFRVDPRAMLFVTALFTCRWYVCVKRFVFSRTLDAEAAACGTILTLMLTKRGTYESSASDSVSSSGHPRSWR